MVLLVHAAFATRPWVEEHLPEWLQSLLQRMDVGVAVFFVLSGFLLFRPFVVRQLPGARRRRPAPSCGGGRCGCSPGTGSHSPSASRARPVLGSVKNAFLYYSLLFPFASQNVALGGGPGHEGKYAIPQAWSLTAEFVFYLMLPVIGYLLVRLVARRAAGAAAHVLLIARGLYLFGQLFRLYFLVAQPSWERVAVIWPPNWVDFFAIGMALAAWRRRAALGAACRRCSRFLGDHPAVSWTIAALVGLSFATFSPPRRRACSAPSTGCGGSSSVCSRSSCSRRRCSATRPQGAAGASSPATARAARHGVAGLLPVPPRVAGQVQEWLGEVGGTSVGASRRCSRSPSCARWVWRS